MIDSINLFVMSVRIRLDAEDAEEKDNRSKADVCTLLKRRHME